MLSTTSQSQLPRFPIDMPGCAAIGQAWPPFRHNSNIPFPLQGFGQPAHVEMQDWNWPGNPIIFISDPHADADAFEASLVASGGVNLTRKGKLKLTTLGRQSVFVVGGDCLDKGPSNLRLLASLKNLMDTGAKVKLLAGNHDLRLLMGLSAISRKRHVGSEHMFVRMGSKVIPLFREVFDRYLSHKKWQKKIPDADTCREHLFPRASWFEAFPRFAIDKLCAAAIEREVSKLEGKVKGFEQQCLDAGMSVQMVYAAARQCEKLFLRSGGEFSWFFRKMQLAYHKGSFLFVHAGLDDEISEVIRKKGVKHLNKRFKKTLQEDLFSFYFSAISSAFRTKYRSSDPVFSGVGARAVQQTGIRAVVHGHVNHPNGQQMSLQEGLLHVEADITLDRNSRRKEGLNGIGFGATIIHPKQMIVGISADYPFAKVLSPNSLPWQRMSGIAYAS